MVLPRFSGPRRRIHIGRIGLVLGQVEVRKYLAQVDMNLCASTLKGDRSTVFLQVRFVKQGKHLF